MNLSKLSIFFGILIISFSGYLTFQRYNPNKLEFKELNVTQNVSTQITPTAIFVPSLNIEKNVFPAKIENGEWEASTEGISYLSSSPLPGQKGNSILYGHNWPNLLGNLYKIKPGEKIVVLMNNGEKRTFVVEYTSIVDPKDTYILNPTNDNRITMYTCIGFLDSKRFVATAILAK